jgi:hypothetical protein
MKSKLRRSAQSKSYNFLRHVSKDYQTAIYFTFVYQGGISSVAGTAELVVLPNLTSCQQKTEEEKGGVDEDKYNGN